MKRTATIEQAPGAASAASPVDSALLPVLAAAVVFVPIVVAVRADDVFRSPKELAFRGAAILMVVIAGVGVLAGRRTKLLSRPVAWPVYGTGAIVLWTAVSTAFSTNVPLSLGALHTVLASAVMFLTATALLRGSSINAVFIAAAPAAANATLSLCQYLNLWRPFTIVYENHDVTHLEGKLSMSGFVGSPNDVGMIVVLPAIATIALTAVTRGTTRLAAGTVSTILVAALFASQSVTAIGAFVVAAAAMLFVAFPRRAGLAAAGAIVVLLAALFGYAPLRQRFTAIAELMRAGEYNHMLAGRLQPYMAAAFMFRDHPLFGAGPGTFHWHYMPYRVEIGHRFPERFVMPGPAIQNFGEAHNDHLQVLAETGLPGYLLFGAALAMLARFSLRVRAPDGSSALAVPRARFVRLFALPFSAGLATLALAQFPLQVAAPRIVYLFLAALIVAWGGADA